MFKWIIKEIKQAKIELELEQLKMRENYKLSKTKPLLELIKEEKAEMRRIVNKEESFSRKKEYQFFVKKEDLFSTDPNSIMPRIGQPLNWNKYVVPISICHGCKEENGYILMEIETQSKNEYISELIDSITKNRKYQHNLEQELKEVKEVKEIYDSSPFLDKLDKYIIHIEKQIEQADKYRQSSRECILICL